MMGSSTIAVSSPEVSSVPDLTAQKILYIHTVRELLREVHGHYFEQVAQIKLDGLNPTELHELGEEVKAVTQAFRLMEAVCQYFDKAAYSHSAQVDTIYDQLREVFKTNQQIADLISQGLRTALLEFLEGGKKIKMGYHPVALE